MKISQSKFNIALSILLAIAVITIVLVPIGSVTADTGVSTYLPTTVTVLSGSTKYTDVASQTASVYVGYYGSAIVEVYNVVTGTESLTVVPQFNNDQATNTSTCASVSSALWFTGTATQIYPLATTVSGITTTNTTLTSASLAYSFSVSGNDVNALEVPIQGRCMRLKFTLSGSGNIYTPTAYMRLVNRQ